MDRLGRMFIDGRATAWVAGLLGAVAVIVGMTGSAVAAPTVAAAAAPAAAPDPVSLVNEFTATQNKSFDFPSVGAPFGMVQQTPVSATRAGVKSRGDGCYADPADELEGFSQTSINGCRFQYVQVMPTTGAITTVDPTRYASPFDRADEQLHPDYANVKVTRYHVRAQLTTTTRTGWERYTFPRTRRANLLFNTGAGVTKSEIRIVGDHTIEGWVQDSIHRAYFYAQVSRPFTAHGTWAGTRRTPGSRQSTHATSDGGWISFDTRTNDAPVTVKLGLSYTGVAGARLNLAAESKPYGFDFAAVHQALHARWNAQLGKIRIGGGTHTHQVVFYTALYHALLDPNVIGDVDGRYMGFDHKLQRATHFTPYSNLSLWDTYRTQNEMIEMLDPAVAHDIDMSILKIGEQGGWLPRWYLEDQEQNIMSGDPITPYLVEGWSKGLISGKAATQAYSLIRKNVTQVPPAGVPENGRAGAKYFDSLGYIPYGLNVTTNAKCRTESQGSSCCPSKGNDNDCYYPGSAPLEYSAADAAFALMAKGTGHAADARTFARLGSSYRNEWDSSIGLFRPRTLDGTWLTPYTPSNGDHAFHEGDPAAYQWLVPQDPAGLAALLGGRAAMTKRLDRFFSYRQLLKSPGAAVRTDWVHTPYDYYGPATYDPDNEPDLLAPYLYAYTGRPSRTDTVVRAAERLYTNTPTGMTGNDDMGEMSAWYVMSAIGLYPTMSGANFYVVTTPLFPHTTIQVGKWNKRQGGTLRISAPGASMSRRYIASATVDGHPSRRDWVSQSAIAHGGSIGYRVSAKPTSWATDRASAPPSIDTAADDQDQLDAQLSPSSATVQPTATSASTQQLSLSLLADVPGSAHVKLSVTAPPGWTATASTPTPTVAAHNLPSQITVPISVTAPAGTEPGSYQLAVSAKMIDKAGTTRTVQKSATISVHAPGGCAATTATSCAVDLGAAANSDGVATAADPGQGDFAGQGASFAANLLPAPGAVTLGGVTYEAPATSGTTDNFVRAIGQTIALPAGNYSQLEVLGAAGGGSTGSTGDTATVTYTDGSTAQVPLRFTDWSYAHAGAGDTVALRMRYGLEAKGGHTTTTASLYRTMLALDPGKTVRSVTLPQPAVSLWLTPGLTQLAWEKDSQLEIYAMTLVSGGA